MKEDLNLHNDLQSLMNGKGLCTAIERDGVICFNKIWAKKLCPKHYQRMKRLGSIDLSILKYKNIKCLSKYCTKTSDDVQLRRNLCNKHYYRWRKYGDYNI